MHLFITEVCTHMHISVTKWCIVGFYIGSFRYLCNKFIIPYAGCGVGYMKGTFTQYTHICIYIYILYAMYLCLFKCQGTPFCLNIYNIWYTKMTSSNGNIFRVTGHLCGEFTGPRWIPRTKASDAELSCFFHLRLNKPWSKQSWGWCLRHYRAHYDVIVMYLSVFQLLYLHCMICCICMFCSNVWCNVVDSVTIQNFSLVKVVMLTVYMCTLYHAVIKWKWDCYFGVHIP